jgi:Asp-tRNA(Asn)/Glu-tRNA(Gln) amidotransferase A subunit family amidase
VTPELYDAANRRRAQALADLAPLFDSYDALIVPASPGEAPLGLDSTGDPVFNRIWTLLRLPCVTVPAIKGPNGMPVGVQVVAAPSADAMALEAARFLELALAS